MLDINLIRENPKLIEEDLKKRKDTEKLKQFKEVIKKDEKWREIKQKLDTSRHNRNKVSQEINQLVKQKQNPSVKIKQTKKLSENIKKLEQKESDLYKEIRKILISLPNITHSSVPYGKDDTENKTIRTFGKKPTFKFPIKSHTELIEDLELGDFEQAALVSGFGFNYLKGDLAILDRALMQFAIDEIIKKKYTLIEPPLMLRRKPYEGVTDLEDFETMMYKIEDEDLYLIATSEHSIGAMLMDKLLEEKDLPLKLVGISPCFRKEIGSHGVDQKGLFRVHQFYKIEQFIFCKPEDSWKFHEELIKNAEDIFKKLKLPFRTVNICTGDIGTVAAKKYDMEAWSPRQKKYIEIVSCSNCTDYQSRRLNTKYQEGNERKLVHTLNSTAIATGRALVALLENNQQKDGSIKIPSVLHKYTGFKKIIKK